MLFFELLASFGVQIFHHSGNSVGRPRPTRVDATQGVAPQADAAQGVGGFHIAGTHCQRGVHRLTGEIRNKAAKNPAMVASPEPVVPTTST